MKSIDSHITSMIRILIREINPLAEVILYGSSQAELYGVNTGNLNKAVKTNISRFPDDFMF